MPIIRNMHEKSTRTELSDLRQKIILTPDPERVILKVGDWMVSLKQYLQITGSIFLIIGVLHFIRLFTGWTIVLVGFTVPVWVSAFGVLIAWFLAYSAFTLAEKTKKS